MSIAERIADDFAAGLDMQRLSKTQIMVLHAIKSIAIKGWAAKALKELQS